MYKIDIADTRAGRETVVVRQNGRRVRSASMEFIQWLHDRVPTKQLRKEQRALVNWYGKEYLKQPSTEGAPLNLN